MVVFGGVLRWRRIAAADVPTGEAEPEVNPPAPRLETFLAAIGSRRIDRPNRAEMRAPHGITSPKGARVLAGPTGPASPLPRTSSERTAAASSPDSVPDAPFHMEE